MSSRVNALIGSYNGASYIRDAIQSALDQTHPCDITIADAGSKDNSWEVINEFFPNVEFRDLGQLQLKQITQDGRSLLAIKIPLVNDKPIGPSETRNIAIELTNQSTDFYQILDQDDWMKPTKIESFLKKMQDPLVGVVYGDYDILNVTTGNWQREYKEPFDMQRLLQECIVHSQAMIRTKTLLAVKDQFGYYDREMRTCEDFDLWIRIAKKGWVIRHIPESLTNVRVHSQNSTNTVPSEIWQRNWARIQAKHGQK